MRCFLLQTLEVDVGDYETFSDSVSPPLPSDTLIPEDDESMDSLGGLTRMPQVRDYLIG